MSHLHKRLRILVVSKDLPRPDLAAGDLRLRYLLQMLAEHHEVHFWSSLRVGAGQHGRRKYEKDLENLGVTVLPWSRGNFLWSLTLKPYDIAIFEFWHCAEWAMKDVRSIQPWVYCVVDSVDIHYQREEAGLTQGIGDQQTVAANKARELTVYREANCVVVVSDDDRRALEAVGGIRAQAVIPTITRSHCRSQAARQAELLFVGGFWHAPNADGILWFVNEIMPLVLENVPQARLLIIGSNAPANVKALGAYKGVEFIGYVQDIWPYLDRAAISVAPLRFGAGMKGKVTEAMSAGLPVVTTSVGAQGLGAEPGRHLLLADTPNEFAGHVTKLLQHPEIAAELGANAQLFIEELCGFEAVAMRVKNLVEQGSPRAARSFARLRLLMGLPHAFRRHAKLMADRCITRCSSLMARAARF